MAAIPPGHRRLENSPRPPAGGARLRGPADPSALVWVDFIVRRRPDAPALPGPAHWMSIPLGRRRFLSRQEFARQFGAAPAELERVAAFARNQGLSMTETSIARRCVIASATVEVMNRLFGVELNSYERGAETYRGYDGYLHLPPDIADILDGVLGLDNRRLGRHATNGGPPGAAPLTPIQVAQFYNFPFPSTNSFKNATGQTIGILEFGGGYNVSDMKSYYSSLNINPQPKVISIPPSVPQQGSAQLPDPEDVEVALDVEVAGSIAAGAKIVIYFGTGFMQNIPDELGWHALLTTAIHDDVNNPTVLSISWSAPEIEWGDSNIALLSPVFQDAANVGMTVFASSGDYGASGFNPNDPDADNLPHVHYPASDPGVTGCGGTIVYSSPPPLAQATWNDQPYHGGATGGGVSAHFTNSADYPWQSDAKISGQPLAGRGVPDVAGNASGFSGYNIIVYGVRTQQLNMNNPIIPANPAGTSAVAPLYAGLIALINANLFPNNITTATSCGFLNPTLYNLGGIQQADNESNTIFQDIADSLDNSFNGVAGFQSTPGWDACTGWGSINGIQFFEMVFVGIVQSNPGCVAAIQSLVRSIGMG
jgi:kumamolisin